MTRLPSRSVLIAISCAALAVSLGGCGRKGPLDLPPQAQAKPATTATPATATTEEQRDPGIGSIFEQSAREPEPDTPRGKKRKFILDPLLGE